MTQTTKKYNQPSEKAFDSSHQTKLTFESPKRQHFRANTHPKVADHAENSLCKTT